MLTISYYVVYNWLVNPTTGLSLSAGESPAIMPTFSDGSEKSHFLDQDRIVLVFFWIVFCTDAVPCPNPNISLRLLFP